MPTAKTLNGNKIWARRRFEIICAVERLGKRAARKEVFDEVSALDAFTTKGPREPELKPPKHYFNYALWKARHLKFLESIEGYLTITDVGQEVLTDGRDK